MSRLDISENLKTVRRNIASACEKAGRDPGEVLLIGATKMNDASRVQEAIAAGLTACGENRVQEMLEKQAQGAYEGAELHFIGHLQKNKAKYVVGLAKLIHGVDSLALLSEIDKQAGKKGIVQDVLLEVNVGAEESKSGFSPEEIPEIIARAADFSHICIRGLMAIPPICNLPEENLPYFRIIHKLFIDICEKKYDNVRMDFMSMGMSGDYTAAISCGANMIRVGTAIFGRRLYPEHNT